MATKPIREAGSSSRRSFDGGFSLEKFRELYIRTIILLKVPDLYSKYSSINSFYTSGVDIHSEKEHLFYKSIRHFEGLDQQEIPKKNMEKLLMDVNEFTMDHDLHEIQDIITGNIEGILHDTVMSIVVEIGKHFLDEFAEYDYVDNNIKDYLEERMEDLNADFSVVTTYEFWNEFLIPDDEADRLSKLIVNALREDRLTDLEDSEEEK